MQSYLMSRMPPPACCVYATHMAKERETKRCPDRKEGKEISFFPCVSLTLLTGAMCTFGLGRAGGTQTSVSWGRSDRRERAILGRFEEGTGEGARNGVAR